MISEEFVEGRGLTNLIVSGAGSDASGKLDVVGVGDRSDLSNRTGLGATEDLDQVSRAGVVEDGGEVRISISDRGAAFSVDRSRDEDRIEKADADKVESNREVEGCVTACARYCRLREG